MSITRRLFLRHTAVAGVIGAAAAGPAKAAGPERRPRELAIWHMRELERLTREDGASSVCVFVVGHPFGGPAGTYTRSKTIIIDHKGGLCDGDGMFAGTGGAS